MDDQDNVVWARLRPLLQRTMPDADIQSISPETTADDVPGWDSMAHVSLIAEVEETFGIVFTPDEMVSFSNLGELVNLIEKKSAETDC